MRRDGLFRILWNRMDANMKIHRTSIRTRAAVIMIAAVVIFTALPLLGAAPDLRASAASVTASGKISDNDVNLRSKASTSSDVVTTLKKSTKLTIYSEVFTTKSSTSATDRWYYVDTGKKKGYVRADLVSDIKYASIDAVTNDELNYRTGPATTFKKLGAVMIDTPVKLTLTASKSGSSETWYRASVNGKIAYISAAYVNIGTTTLLMHPKASQLKGKSSLAVSLLSTPSRGGKARVVYTFSTKNCKKLFSIKGYKNAKVPQGLAFSGSKYYVLYGMAAGQGIVTYSSGGNRLKASKFAFQIGHPNGITYDPATKLCYIFKGNTKKIYTWNPSTGKYGKSKTPYSSSGIGYDNSTKDLYASSRTGIRQYSADGKFIHKKLFPRCSHGIFHYTQDCGSGEGFVFHGISGVKKKKTNYIDIYRVADGAYLGSIKITIGEVESAVVGSDGYLQLLINIDGEKDHIWRTPLNVRELKLK